MSDVAHRHGLDMTGARVIRLGENAVLHLPSMDAAAKLRLGADAHLGQAFELRVAGALLEAGVPTVSPLAGRGRPLRGTASSVALWKWINGAQPAGASQLGLLLRRLHRVEITNGWDLPRFEPFVLMDEHLTGGTISDRDVDLLQAEHRRLRDAYANLPFELGLGVLHGDAHVDNVLVDHRGVALLSDLERCCVGPLEWDLAYAAAESSGLGWRMPSERAELADSYGFDVVAWSGYPTLLAIRRLRMTAWLAQKVHVDSRAALEFDRRIDALRRQDFTQPWSRF